MFRILILLLIFFNTFMSFMSFFALQRRVNVDVTSRRHIDVDTTLFRRHVRPG